MFKDVPLTEIFDLSKANNVTLYGEGYGAKIQKGGGNYIPDNQDLILFDINIDGVWLEGEYITELAEKMNLKRVPILGTMTTDDIVEFVRREPKSRLGDFAMEGVVCRSKPLLLDRMGERLAFKLKVRDFK
jgi:ATP-dependent RNA circularization protein (DNA/RNA ligase family)